jgi:hypothetical protein
MNARVVISLACLALAVESSAHADNPVRVPAAVEDAQAIDLEVGAVVGALTPIGTYGVEAQLGITPWFAIAAGTGYELLGGVQAGVMPRVRIPFGSHMIYAGVGGSWGDYKYPSIVICPFGPCTRDADGEATYLTSELGYEEHTDHVFARAFAGGKAMTNYESLCPSGRCDRYFAYGGFAAGVRF